MDMKKKYEDFSLALALFDALPVIFFSAAMLVIAAGFRNPFFIIGAVLCSLAGLGKVVWKIILAATRKDIFWLNRQMRFLMPAGFLLLILAVVTGMTRSGWGQLLQLVLSMPSVLFFAVTVIGMVCMGIFAFRLDPTKARSNWIEQITNAVAQGCFLLGVIFCVF